MNTPQEEVETLLCALKGAHGNLKRWDEISDEILARFLAYSTPAEELDDIMPGIHFTRAETRVVSLLLAKKNHVVSREAILAASAAKYWTEMPEPKIIDVRMCFIRKKMAAANAPYEIETIWGQGFRLKSKPVAGTEQARAA